MTRSLQFLIVIILSVGVSSVNTQPARANPALLLAPEVAVGLLESMILASAAAAAVGVISQSQNQEFHNELQTDIDQIQQAVRKGLNETKIMIVNAIAALGKINSHLQTAESCQVIQKVQEATQTTQKPFSKSNKTDQARSATTGECKPELRGDPFKCCPEFMKKFSNEKKAMSPVGRFAYRLEYYLKYGPVQKCCFEWDSLHGRFEIYQSSNHDGVRHVGEKACAREEDLDENICDSTFPDKADFLSRRHSPREGCQ